MLRRRSKKLSNLNEKGDRMNKHLYYRVMGPTAGFALLMLLIPGIPMRSLFGFLVMFLGFGRYYYLISRK